MQIDFPGVPSFSLDDPDIECDCVSGDQWHFIDSPSEPRHDGRRMATTTFQIPVDSPSLAFRSSGSYAFGHVDIVSAEAAGDQVQVDIEAYYYSRHALDRATVCRYNDQGSGHGVALLVSVKLCICM